MIKNINNIRIIKANSVNNIKDTSMFLMRGGPLDEIDILDQSTLLNKYNLKTVVDLRSSEEAEKSKNIKIVGVDYYHIEIFDPTLTVLRNPTKFLKEYKKCDEFTFMQLLYREFVLSDYSKDSYRQFLEVVANSRGSVYFHCSAGKDRTGFAAMLLMEILGASEKDIYLDYLKTNDFTEKNFHIILETLKNIYNHEVSEEVLIDLIGVKKSYLDTCRQLILSKHQTIIDFIKFDLGVCEKTMGKIKEKFVV